MKAAVEHHFNGLTGPLTGPYDSTKTLIASLLRQASGSSVEDNFISTKPSAMVNLPEIASAQAFPHVVKWSDNIYWVFVTASVGASVTRTISLYEFNSNTSVITYRGFITLSGTIIASVKFPRALRAFVYKHTTGTVSTSGASTTITGNSTQFTTERIAVGARIGFGATDPTQVTTWYEVTSISSDTSLTINAPVTLSAGTSYVIEEIRIALASGGAGGSFVIINGGIHLIKGLNVFTFTPGGTTIPEATTVDNIRASYLLKDAVFNGAGIATFTVTIASPAVFTINNHGLQNGDTILLTTTGALPTGLAASPSNTANIYYIVSATTNTFLVSSTLNGTAINTSGTQSGTHTAHHYPSNNANGMDAEPEVSKTEHNLYLVAGIGTNTSIIKYNMRAALTVGALGSFITAGVSTSAYSLKTATVAGGTITAVNSSKICTVNHGPASGSNSLYNVTTNRIYRYLISNITAGSTNYVADGGMIEVAPGASTTYSPISTLYSIDYLASIDRLLITNSGGRLGTYVTTYNTTGDQSDKLIGANMNRLKLTTTPAGSSDGLFPQAALTLSTMDGWVFCVPNTTTTGQNWLLITPFGADAYYNSTSNQHIITPKLATPNASKLYHVYVDHQEYAGTYGLGFPVETYKLWYRTSGIDDNSGAWTEVPVGADMGSAAPGDYIQFKIAFDIMGEICVPTRIYSICCTYEDKSQDSHYEPSLTKSSAQNRQFAWRQISSWGGTIPNLRIRLFNVANGATVLDDNVTSNTYGTWEYSTNGTNWSAWSSSADTIGNYIRYTADDGIIGNLITVRALLTQA